MRAHVAGRADPALLGTIAAEIGMAGDPAESRRRSRSAPSSAATRAGPPPPAGPGTTPSARWSVAERYEMAQRAWTSRSSAAERGAVIDVGGVLIFRGELAVRVGDLGEREVDAGRCSEIASVYGWPIGAGLASPAWRGADRARRARGGGAGAVERAVRRARGGPAARLCAHLGAAGARPAPDRARPAGRRGRRAARVRPAGGRDRRRQPGVVALALELAHVCSALGQVAEARALTEEELDAGARARRAARARGRAARGRARPAATRRSRCCARRSRRSRPRAARLETARAQADARRGATPRGDTDAAREPCDARSTSPTAAAPAPRGRGARRAAGHRARPRRRLTTGAGALTPSERRIAELAAGGQQNREIAEALFVTTATVEYHLRNAYRKLGIASRTQLGSALA